MNRKDREVLALTECLLIWDYLAETGSNDKQEAIDYLWEEDLLTQDVYSYACPFCEYLRDHTKKKDQGACRKCLWPGEKDLRCTFDESPFVVWHKEYFPKDHNVNKKNAKQVLALLLTLGKE